MKILLVEDSKPIRRENETVLQQAGYEVICAEDGETALQMAREQRPDLILLDMILPKVSGPEVLRSLKSDGSTADDPGRGVEQPVREEPAETAGRRRGRVSGEESW